MTGATAQGLRVLWAQQDFAELAPVWRQKPTYG
jgi:hypothetical protein